MSIAMDMAAARAGLDELLAEERLAGAVIPQEIKNSVLAFLDVLAPTYHGRKYEWDALAAEVRAKFDIELPAIVDPILKDIPAEFAAVEHFADIVEDGFFAAYLDYTKESEAPTQFHFGSLLACASGALARRPLLGWHAAPTYPNIYMLLVGPTGTRKSSALGKARELVEAAFPVVKGQAPRVNVLPNEGSPQGFASALRNRNFARGDGISDGLVVASELTVLVGKEVYKAALGSWLVDWYDNLKPVWSRALKGEETYELPAPYVCFAGASNMTWLKEIPDQLIKAGYMPRHLVFEAREKRHDHANPQFDEAIAIELRKQLAERTDNLPAEMPLAPATAVLMTDWYMGKVARQERGEVDELFAAWLSRKLPHALKVATVWQIVDGGPREALHVDWLRKAIRLIDWMDAGVLRVYYSLGSTGEGAVTEAVKDYIEKRGGSLTLTQVARGLRNKYNKKSVMDGVQTLVMAGLLTTKMDGMKGTVLTLMGEG